MKKKKVNNNNKTIPALIEQNLPRGGSRVGECELWSSSVRLWFVGFLTCFFFYQMFCPTQGVTSLTPLKGVYQAGSAYLLCGASCPSS
jgi:hypothetical protein